MRKFLFVLLLMPGLAYAQSPQQIGNQRAFTKLYGYLKYFYPGDEAAKINWDKFAIYGARKVDACKNPSELKDSLQVMIYPLMPGVKILDATEKITFDKISITPPKLSGYETVAWQHSGVGLVKDPRSPYALLLLCTVAMGYLVTQLQIHTALRCWTRRETSMLKCRAG